MADVPERDEDLQVVVFTRGGKVVLVVGTEHVLLPPDDARTLGQAFIRAAEVAEQQQAQAATSHAPARAN